MKQEKKPKAKSSELNLKSEAKEETKVEINGAHRAKVNRALSWQLYEGVECGKYDHFTGING